MKEFLSRAGNVYRALVDEDETAYDELIALGYRTVPVTVIDGEASAASIPPRWLQLSQPAADA